MYKKSMSEALQEARDFRDTSGIDEGSYRGYEIKRQNNKYGHPLIVPALKLTGANMKDIKQLIDRHFLFSIKKEQVDEGKGFLEYDEWLKQVKGIKKGAYGINSDEHAKYSAEWRAYIKGLFDNLPPIKKESDLEEIVGGHGDMTITKDGGVMIIKTRDWQTYKAKGWVKREEVENESLDLSATGDTTTSNASQEVEGEELNEFWPFKKKPTGYNPKAYVKAYDLFRKAYDELKKSGAIDRKKQAELQQVYYHMVTDFLGSRDAGRLEIKTIDGTDKRWGDGKPFPKDDRD